MTTRPSSSPRSSTRPKTLFDAISQPIDLGDELGRGGEGSVFEVQGNPSLVAKVYHKTPLAEDHVAKLRPMSAVWSANLEKISAWPRTILFDPIQRKPCGLLMSKMEGARPLHELYGTTARRRHFPDVGWHHLVLAARNAAAAFNTLHAVGIVVGDVNQGNLLVDEKMCVRMIDCDSFQIVREGKIFNCPVGSPHFTPPELQGQRLRDVVRTVNHDRFGLATLIFHLLFVGRHPFAGRFRGQGDLSIEKAIAESRFAFSPNKAETQVDPPPASLLLDDLPQGLANLFEAAFRPKVMRGNFRPSPEQWIQELELLIKRRKACNIDPMHVFAPEAGRCPWCWIEDIGGPSFFVPSDVPSTVTSLRQARLDETVSNLPEVEFPALPPERIALPTLPKLKPVKPRPKLTAARLGRRRDGRLVGGDARRRVCLARGACCRRHALARQRRLPASPPNPAANAGRPSTPSWQSSTSSGTPSNQKPASSKWGTARGWPASSHPPKSRSRNARTTSPRGTTWSA